MPSVGRQSSGVAGDNPAGEAVVTLVHQAATRTSSTSHDLGQGPQDDGSRISCDCQGKASPKRVSISSDVSDFGGISVGTPSDTALEKMKSVLPFFTAGRVVKGYGRGSKDLGTPTANLSRDVVQHLNPDLVSGVYYGWAKVDAWPVMKMVMNLGWNPFFQNKERSLEVHILHQFPCDFYDACLRICILGYLRPEAKFTSVDNLIKSIQRDIDQATELLDEPDAKALCANEYFLRDCDRPLD